MKEEDFNDLMARLRDSATPPVLKKELSAILRLWRHHFHEIHSCTSSKSTAGAHFISGMALGKDGFSPGDMGL